MLRSCDQMCGKIKIKQGTKMIPVPVQDIIRFEGGKNNCSYVFLAKAVEKVNGTPVMSYKITGNVGEWMKDAEIIASGLFVLVHRSHLINYKHVTSFDKTQGAIMNNNVAVPLTTEGFDELDKRIFSGDDVASDIYSAIQHERKIFFERREPDEDEVPRNDEEE